MREIIFFGFDWFDWVRNWELSGQAVGAFLQGEASAGDFADAVQESDEFGRVFCKGIAGDLLTLIHKDPHVINKRDFLTDFAEQRGVGIGVFAQQVSGGVSPDLSAIVDGSGIEIILKAAETPVADVVFVQVFAGFAKCFDDGFIRDTIVEHAIDLVPEFRGKAGDLAVAA